MDTAEIIAQSSRQALLAGERIAADVDLLEGRLEHAVDWRARLREHPLWFIGLALAGGFLLWRLFR